MGRRLGLTMKVFQEAVTGKTYSHRSGEKSQTIWPSHGRYFLLAARAPTLHELATGHVMDVSCIV